MGWIHTMEHYSARKGLFMLSVCVCVFSHFSCVWLFCDPMDYSLPGSSVHGILQARILEWVTMPSSRGFFQPRDQTCSSCIAGGFFTTESPGKSMLNMEEHKKHCTTWKKPVTKGHVLYDFIYIKYHNRPIHRDNRLTVAWGKKRKWEIRTNVFLFWGDENILELNSGDGCTTLWIY